MSNYCFSARDYNKAVGITFKVVDDAKILNHN